VVVKAALPDGILRVFTSLPQFCHYRSLERTDHNAERFFRRGYLRKTISCRALQLNAPTNILLDLDYPMHVVRHDLKHICLRVRKIFRYVPPARSNDLPSLRQSHLPGDNLTENGSTACRANGDKEVPPVDCNQSPSFVVNSVGGYPYITHSSR